MEKKTIGSFIAALRKASGFTQRQLAEKLNVSDKAVSRWERDESMPDLTLIPVLAEIFGVTSDEILRGERSNANGAGEKTPGKAEKQRKHFISERQTKYRIRSMVSLGIGLLGLIAAGICNFGFLRAYLGFMIGCAFFLAAAVCQSIFLTLHLSGVDEELLQEHEMIQYREHSINLAAWVYGTLITLISICLPLVTIPWDTYQGLEGAFWLLFAAVYALITVVVLGIVWAGIRLLLARRGLLTLSSLQRGLLKLRLRFTGVFVPVIAVLMIIQAILNSFLPSVLMDGTELHSWDEFKVLMETPVEYDGANGELIHQQPINGIGTHIAANTATESIDVPIPSVSAESGQIEYGEDGTVIIEPDADTQRIYDGDGKLLCTFHIRNHSISGWSYEYNSQDVTITVHTVQDVRQANSILENLINPIYVLTYPLSALIMILLYRKKARELKNTENA